MKELDSRIHRELQRVSGRLLRDGGLPVFEIDEDRICFALELAGTLGALQGAFEKLSRELFGVCVLVRMNPVRESVVTLRTRMSSLVSRPQGSIVWCDNAVATILAPWARFSPSHDGLFPLSSLGFPPDAPSWPAFWHLSPAPEHLALLFPQGVRSPRAFSVFSAPPGLGIHHALKEASRVKGREGDAFTIVFEEPFHPLYAIARAIKARAEVEGPGVDASKAGTNGGIKTAAGSRAASGSDQAAGPLFEELERCRLLASLPLRMERSLLDLFAQSLAAWARRCRLAGTPAVLCLCGIEHAGADLERSLLSVLVPLAETHNIHIIASVEGHRDLAPWLSAGARLEHLGRPEGAATNERASRLFPALGPADLHAAVRASASSRHNADNFLVETFRACAARALAAQDQAGASPSVSSSSQATVPGRDEIELLYTLSLLTDFLPGPDALEAVRRAGVSDECLRRALVRLSERGLIPAPDNPRCIRPLEELLAGLRAKPQAENESDAGASGDTDGDSDGHAADAKGGSIVRALVERALVAAHDQSGLRASAALLALFNRVGASLPDALFLEALEHDFSRMPSALFTSGAPELAVPDSVPEGRRALFSWLYTGRSILLYSALGGDRAAADRFFSRTPPAINDSDVFTAIADLNRASWFYLKGALPEAGNSAKQALMRMQGSTTTLVLPRLYCQVALIEIAKERIREGLDYLGFAVESAERSVLPEELVRALCLAAVGEFLWGNLARAERLVRRALSLSRSLWYDEWEDWTRFFLGRILFETGRYRDAIDSFDAVIAVNTQSDSAGSTQDAGKGAHPRRAALCRVWRYRALVHSGALSEAPPAGIPVAGDLGLFTVEALCLRRDYSGALERALSLMDAEEPVSLALFDRPGWDSGFDWIDNRYLVPGGIRLELLKVFSNLARANAGQSELAAENMRKMIKEDRLSELDTSDAFSYWVYSHCLFLFGAESVDYGTVLSLAFKRFQRRSSRIDDLDTKRAFMSLHRWNAMLVQDAKKGNLL